MTHDDGVRAEGAMVVPFAPTGPRAVVPPQRGGDHEDLASLGISVEDPVRFFAGLVHAVWMMALASAVVVAVVLATDTVI
ncbi:hypothetical protein KLP28_06205 [Nocardioidaceae bacterium]|nr:hypothetical protein KLP28_06205 [Nocardioidaceae bacterium]